MNQETFEINKILKQKFPNQNSEEYFKEYYHEIIHYINHFEKTVTFVLEGQHLYRYLTFEDLKGTLIVKRTSILKCWKRSITRHIKRKKVELDNHQITKKQYFQNIWYWIKRRTKQLIYYKNLNRFLAQLDKKGR